MNLKQSILKYFSFLAIFALVGCLGAGNEELEKQTFGLQIIKVKGDNQVLENPLELAPEELTVKVLNTDGQPLKKSTVNFILVNPDSGALVLSEVTVTDDLGVASTKIRGGDDFGKQARVLVQVSQTNLSAEFLVSIRDKIIPDAIEIVKPSDVVAGIPTSIQLRLVDKNGKLSFEDEFQTKVRVVFSSPSGSTNNTSKFAPVAAVEREVNFVKGLASLNNVWGHKAEDVTIQLEDPGDIGELEAQLNRTIDISDTEVLKIVPAAPVRITLEDPDDATTDDQVLVEAKIYDNYDNIAYNYSNACSIDIELTGDRPEVVNTTYADPKTGRMVIASGVGRVNIIDTKVETVDIAMDNPVGCGAINSGDPSSYASTQDVYFGPGVPAQVIITQPSVATETVDNAISMSLQAQDAGGNNVTDFNRTVQVKVSGARSYLPPTTAQDRNISVVNGVASFDVRDKAVEQVTVSLVDVAATGLEMTSTQTVNFTVGAAKQFAFSDATYSGDADDGVDVTIEVWDQYGNLLNNWAGGSVNVIADGSSDATGAGKTVNFSGSETTKTINITDRVNENINLSMGSPSGSLLVANDGSLATADTRFTATANIQWGVIKQIVMEDPTDGTIDNPVDVTVRAQDNWGNTVLNYNTSDVRLDGNKNSTNSGVITINNGVGTRSISDTVNETIDLSLNLASGVTQLQNSLGENINISSTQDLYFKWGAPTRFTLVDPADGTVDNPITVTASARDAGNNLVLDYNGSVTIRVNRDATHDAYLSGTQQKVLTFDGSTGIVTTNIYDQVAETVNIDLVDSAGTGLNVSSTQSVIFAPGTVTRFAYDNAPAATVDDPVTLTVKSFDQFGNHNVSYTELAALDLRWVDQKDAEADPDPNNLDIDFNAGVGRIDVADTTVETVRVGLAAKTGYDTTSEIDVVFDPGEVTQFAILPPAAASITADNPVNVQLEARDQYDNLNPSYEDDITFLVNNAATLSNGNQEIVVDVVAGQATVVVTDTVAEQITLSLRDDYVPTRNLNLPSVDITILPGAPAKYKITSAPNGTTDDPVSIIVQAQDQFGNRAFGHEDDVQVNVSQGTAAILASTPASDFEPDGSNNLDVTVNIINGQGTVYLVDRVVETAKLYLSNIGGQTLGLEPAQTDGHEDVAFAHGSPSKYVFLPLSTTANTDGPFAIDVEAQDKWDNKATTFSADVSVRVDKNAVVSGTTDKVAKVTISNGAGSIDIEDSVVENGVVATLGNELGSNVANLDTSDTLLFNVTFGAPSYYAIIKPAIDATTDGAITIDVEVRDQNHNLITSGFNGKVNFHVNELTDAFIGTAGVQQTVLDFAGQAGSASVDVSNQTAELVGLYLSQISGQPALTLTDQSNPLEVKNVRFKAGTVTKFEFVADNCVSVDNDCSVDIDAQDQYGNKNLEFGGTAVIKASFDAGKSAYFVGGSDIDFSNGEGVLTIGDNVNETVTLTMTNQSGGSYTFVNTRTINFLYGAPTRYEYKTPGVATTTDDPVTIEVQAVDQYGNIVLDYGSNPNQDVNGTVVSGGDSLTGIGPISNFTNGVGSMSVAKTVVGTVVFGLSNLNDSLDVSDTLTVNFAHGAVDYFTIIAPSGSWSVDNTHQLRVEARDKNNNLATSYGGSTKTVDLAFNTNGANATGDGEYQFASGFFLATLGNTLVETTQVGLSNPGDSGVDVTSTRTINWVAGAPAQLVVLPQSGPNYTVDDTPTIRVESRDQHGNFSNQFNGTATFSINKNGYLYNAVTPTDRSSQSNTVSFVSGVSNVEVEDFTAETGVQVSASAASDANITTYTPALINFSHGVAFTYDITSTDGTVDDPVDVTVEVHDRGGNIVLNQATHNLRLKTNRTTTAFIPSSGEISLVGGQGTLQLTDTVAEDAIITVDTAGDAPTPQTNTTSVSSISTFGPGVVTKLVLFNPASATAGQNVTLRVEAQDQYGNINNTDGETYQIDVEAYKASTVTQRSLDTISTTAGVGSATRSYTVAEDLDLLLANIQQPATGLNSNGDAIDITSTGSMTINPDAPVELEFAPTSNDNVDNYITITINVIDQYGNTVTAANDQVAEFTLSSASGQAAFTPPQGNLTSNIFTLKNGTGTYRLYNTVAENVLVGMQLPASNPANTTALTLASDITVTFAPGAPQKYMIIPPGSTDVVAGANFKVVVQDQYSNTIPTAGTAGSPGRVKINATISGGTVVVGQGATTANTTLELEVVNGEASVDIDTTKAGTAKLQLLATDLTDPLGLTPNATIHDVVFDAGPPATIAISDPIDSTVDSTGVDLTIQSFDVYGNPNSGFSGQSIRINVDGNATFVGTGGQNFTTVTFAGGTASAQVVDQLAETVNLSLAEVSTYFSDNSINITATEDLVFSPGAITQFVFDTVPSTVSVDNATAGQTISIKALDQYGNHQTDPTIGSLTSELDVSVTGSPVWLNGDTGKTSETLDFTNGVATFTVHKQIVGMTTLKMDSSASGHSLGANVNFNWVAGATAFITMDDPTDVTVDQTSIVTLRARDQYCNPNTSFGGSNTVAPDYTVKNTPETVTFTPSTVGFSNGVGTFTVADTKNETITLTLDGSGLSAGISAVSTCMTPNAGPQYPATQNIQFTPGGLRSYEFVGQPTITGADVDAPKSVDVRALDQYGNLIGDFNSANRLTITSDSATTSFSGSPVSFTSGVGSFDVSEQTMGTHELGMTLNAADTANSIGTETIDITFDHGEARKFSITVPGDVTIDDQLVVDVRAQDQFGNLHNDYAGDVTAKTTSTSPEEPVSDVKYSAGVTETFVNGVGNFTIESLKAETTSFKIFSADNNAGNTSMTVNQTASITFTPGAAQDIEIQAPTSTSVDNKMEVKIHLLDRGGNLSTSDNTTGVARLTIGGTNSGSCTINKEGETSNSLSYVAFDSVAGIGTVDIRCEKVGTYDLVISNTSLNIINPGSQEYAEFTAGSMNKVAFVAPTPSSSAADSTFSISLEARDQFDNIVSDYAGRVRLTNASSSQNVTIPDTGLTAGVVQFASGLASMSGFQVTTAPQTVTFGLQAVSGYAIPNLTETTDVVISHGTPAQIRLASLSDQTVGNNQTVTLELYDDYSNLCTTTSTFTVDVDVDSSVDNTSITVNGGTTNGTTPHTINVTGGTATVTLYSELAQTVTVGLENPSISITAGADKSFTYLPDAAAELAFLSASTTVTTDDTFGLQMQAVDQYGNLATNFNSSSIYLTATPGTNLVNSVGSAPIVFTGGNATYNVQNKTPQTVVFGFDSGTMGGLSGQTGADTFTMTVNVGAPDHFTLGSAPTGITADDTAVASISVFSYDQWNNLSPTTEDVQLNLTGSASFDDNSLGTLTLDFNNEDTKTVTFTDRVAQTITVSMSLPTGSMTLDGGAKTVIIAHGSPAEVIFNTPITSAGRTDAPASVEVQLLDAYGNLCTGTTGQNIDLSTVFASGTSGAITGGGTKTFASGKATYTLSSTTEQVVTMSLSATGLTMPSNEDISFAWGDPFQYAFTTLTDAVVNGNVSVAAEVRDSAGNRLQAYSGEVTFSQSSFAVSGSSASGNPPSGFANATTSNGVFSIGTITSQQAGTLSVQISQVSGDGSLSPAVGNVDFTPGGATQILITVQDDDGIITSPETVRVYALDNFWNTTSHTGSVDFTLSAGCGQAKDCSDTAIDDGYFSSNSTQSFTGNFVNGQVDVQIQKTTTGWTKLSASSAGLTLINNSGTGEEFYFLPGDPVEYTILNPGYLAEANFKTGDGCDTTSTCHGSTDGPVSLEIHAVDSVGSRSQTYDGSVEVYISNDPNSESVYGAKRVNFVQGKATISLGNSAAETVTVALRDSQDSDTTANSLSTSNTFALKFGQGKVDRIALATPATIFATETTTLSVTAVDENGDLVDSYRGNFELAGNSKVSGIGNFNVIDGEAELTIGSNYIGTWALSLVDTSSTGLNLDTTNLIVQAKDPTRMPFYCESEQRTTDERKRCYIYVEDQYYNDINNWVGSAKIEVVDGNGDYVPEAKFWSAATGGTLLWEGDTNDDGTYDGDYIQNWNSNGYHKTIYVSTSVSEIIRLRTVQIYDGINATGSTPSPTIYYSYSPSFFMSPAVPKKFEIDTPIADGTVGGSGAVTIKAYNASDELAASYDGYVYLRVTNDPGEASASVPSNGLVHLINGQATVNISNTEIETLEVSLERVDSTYNDITMVPDSALSESVNLNFVSAAPAALVLEDPGTGTSGLPLTVTVSLKDSNGYAAVNNTGSDITVSLASDDGNYTVGSPTVTIPDGSASATFTVSSNEVGSANITASNGSLTNATRAISFDVGDVTEIAHTGAYSTSTDGTITVELEALSAAGIRNTDYSGVFGVNINNAASGSISASSTITITNGVGSMVISSTRNQTVDFNVYDYFATLTMPSDISLDFSTGVPSKITISTQPVADVMKDTVFTTAGVFQITDDDGTVKTSATDLITLTVFKGSGCSDSPTGTLGGTTSKAAVSGEATFSDLTYSETETISIRASAGSYTSACTSALEIFGPLSLSASPGTSTTPGSTVTIKATGGVQPISFSLAQNNSGATIGSAYSCDGNKVCADYTAGPQGGGTFDIVSATDSDSGSEVLGMMVMGAKLENTAGDLSFGAVENSIDQSETFTFENTGMGATSTLSVTWTPADDYAEDESQMWSVNDVACDGADLAADDTCDITVDFLGATGPGVERTYSGTLTVEGASGGKVEITISAILAPKFSSSETSWNFGSAISTKAFTISNLVSGSTTDTISAAVEAQGGDDCAGYSITANSCTTLNDSSTCSVTVRFDPSAYGPSATYTCQLSLDATNAEKLYVPLSGTNP